MYGILGTPHAATRREHCQMVYRYMAQYGYTDIWHSGGYTDIWHSGASTHREQCQLVYRSMVKWLYTDILHGGGYTDIWYGESIPIHGTVGYTDLWHNGARGEVY